MNEQTEQVLVDEFTPRCMVAMPFNEKWSKNVFDAIEDVMRRIKIDVFRVDTTKRQSLKLATDVERQIRNTDILIADVTTKNSNVHIEIGLSIANKKPILICTQNDDDVCAHISDYLYIVYSADKTGLHELSRQLRLRIQEIIDRANLEEKNRRLTQQIKAHYSVECFRDRIVANLGESFLNARKRIDILTTT